MMLRLWIIIREILFLEDKLPPVHPREVLLEDTIYMLVVYKKGKKEDLTRTQLKALRQLIEGWLK